MFHSLIELQDAIKVKAAWSMLTLIFLIGIDGNIFKCDWFKLYFTSSTNTT